MLISLYLLYFISICSCYIHNNNKDNKDNNKDNNNNNNNVDLCLSSSFIFLQDIDSTIIQDIRYYTTHNFMGRRVEGYNTPSCILTIEAANMLKLIQIDAINLGYSLKVYDCYRPQQAVDDFVNWANNSYDLLMKTEFYPTIEKQDLFPDYIATKSGHSRGSTVDLTIVKLPIQSQEIYYPGQPLVNCYAPYNERFYDNSIDMGTGFDCLSPYANTNTDLVGSEQHDNRMILFNLMSSKNFTNYSGEWWHYTLQNEPFPNTYFNFPIQKCCPTS